MGKNLIPIIMFEISNISHFNFIIELPRIPMEGIIKPTTIKIAVFTCGIKLSSKFFFVFTKLSKLFISLFRNYKRTTIRLQSTSR